MAGPPQSPGFFDMAPIFRPVNVQALWAMQGRVPCAPREVAPGTWATFDCAPFQALTRAVQYIPFVRFNLPSDMRIKPSRSAVTASATRCSRMRSVRTYWIEASVNS